MIRKRLPELGYDKGTISHIRQIKPIKMGIFNPASPLTHLCN
jgi:hypothetical protein